MNINKAVTAEEHSHNLRLQLLIKISINCLADR